MVNFAVLLKAEITRLARKEVRSEIQSLKSASAQYRTDIAALKRQVALLERSVAKLATHVASAKATSTEEASGRVRFSVKGFASLRTRLGLSGPEMAKLLGVSVQSVYHWEAGKSKPRQAQLASIAALRSMGKRAAAAKLATL